MRVEEQLIGTGNRVRDLEKSVVAKGDRWGEWTGGWDGNVLKLGWMMVVYINIIKFIELFFKNSKKKKEKETM